MPTIDEHQIWQDERAATLRERDRHREPAVRFPMHKPGVAPPRSIRLACPRCNGPVYAMTDSLGEPVTCTNPLCLADLRARASNGGVELVVADDTSDEQLRLLRMADADGGP